MLIYRGRQLVFVNRPCRPAASRQPGVAYPGARRAARPKRDPGRCDDQPRRVLLHHRRPQCGYADGREPGSCRGAQPGPSRPGGHRSVELGTHRAGARARSGGREKVPIRRGARSCHPKRRGRVAAGLGRWRRRAAIRAGAARLRGEVERHRGRLALEAGGPPTSCPSGRKPGQREAHGFGHPLLAGHGGHQQPDPRRRARADVLGADHLDTLASRSDLGSAYREAGRLGDAINLYKRTLADRERIQGPDHPDTLAARGNLAYAYHTARRPKDAIPLYERTLADRQRIQGPDHPDTITARGNLAYAYHTARRLADAIPLYERTLADCERVLGPDHPDTLTSRGNVGHAYHTAGRLTDAIKVFRRTLADCERILGPEPPLTKFVGENLDAATQT